MCKGPRRLAIKQFSEDDKAETDKTIMYRQKVNQNMTDKEREDHLKKEQEWWSSDVESDNDLDENAEQEVLKAVQNHAKQIEE